MTTNAGGGPDRLAGLLRTAYRHPVATWLAACSAVAILWLLTVLPFLGHYPSVGGDAVWNMSPSYKLMSEGVFGSDLFVGFFNADRHYFLNLPLHHLWQAAAFLLFEPSILTARAVSAVMALLVVALVSGLALRWYGLTTALLTAFLLTFWRSGVTGAGVPLLSIGRLGRSDVDAVLWIWLAVGLLAAYGERRSPLVAALVGVSCGLAGLTQIVGPIGFALAAVCWVVWHGRRVPTTPSTYALGVGALATLAPYLLYIGRHSADFVSQRVKDAARGDFLDPSFYGLNILREPLRYAHLVDLPGQGDGGYQAMSTLLVLFVVPPVAWHLWRRSRGGSVYDFVLLATVLVAGACLLFLEQTKAPLYAAPLVPALCVGVSVAVTDWGRWLRHADRPARVRRRGTLVLVALLSVVALEGAATYAVSWRRAQGPDHYQLVAQRLLRQIPAGSEVIGFEQWWWPLQDHAGYRAWVGLWWQWTWHDRNQDEATSLITLVERTPASHLVVTRLEPLYIQAYPPAMQAQFERLVTRCTTQVDTWIDAEYGQLAVYRLRRDDGGSLRCVDR